MAVEDAEADVEEAVSAEGCELEMLCDAITDPCRSSVGTGWIVCADRLAAHRRATGPKRVVKVVVDGR